MQKQKMRFHWLIFSLVLLFVTTGCFQQVGRSRLSPTELAQGQEIVTFTPAPSATPTTETQGAQDVTEEVATQIVQAPTEEDQFLRGTEISAMMLLTQQVPTETPTPSLTPTVTPSLTPTIQPTEIAMLQGTIDPIALTVTAILAQQAGGQQQPQLPTQAPLVQEQPIQVQPVQEQPVQEQPQVEDPIALTATFIVERATMTAAAPMTMTAAAAGIGLPTMTPTLDELAEVTPTPGAPVSPGADCVHQVRAEDRNLYRISLLYGVNVEDIARASGIANINLILVGQKLTIPRCGTTGYTPPPTSIPPGGDQGGGAAQSAGRIHVVRQGETLFEISLRYGVTVHDIAGANGIANINLIYIGQELVIP